MKTELNALVFILVYAIPILIFRPDDRANDRRDDYLRSKTAMRLNLDAEYGIGSNLDSESARGL